jgi:hypothetical protein
MPLGFPEWRGPFLPGEGHIACADCHDIGRTEPTTAPTSDGKWTITIPPLWIDTAQQGT